MIPATSIGVAGRPSWATALTTCLASAAACPKLGVSFALSVPQEPLLAPAARHRRRPLLRLPQDRVIDEGLQ